MDHLRKLEVFWKKGYLMVGKKIARERGIQGFYRLK